MLEELYLKKNKIQKINISVIKTMRNLKILDLCILISI